MLQLDLELLLVAVQRQRIRPQNLQLDLPVPVPESICQWKAQPRHLRFMEQVARAKQRKRASCVCS